MSPGAIMGIICFFTGCAVAALIFSLYIMVKKGEKKEDEGQHRP